MCRPALSSSRRLGAGHIWWCGRRQNDRVAENEDLPELAVDLTEVAIQDWTQLWDAL